MKKVVQGIYWKQIEKGGLMQKEDSGKREVVREKLNNRFVRSSLTSSSVNISYKEG